MGVRTFAAIFVALLVSSAATDDAEMSRRIRLKSSKQLRALLAESWSRVRDLFAEWDASGDGMVDREE